MHATIPVTLGLLILSGLLVAEETKAPANAGQPATNAARAGTNARTATTNTTAVTKNLTNATATNAAAAKDAPKAADLTYWEETMQFGTGQQKEAVLKVLQTIQHASVDRILLAALKNEPDGPVHLKLIQMLYERKIPGALQPLVATLTNSTDADTLTAAIAALAKFKDKTTVAAIVRFVTNDNTALQQTAVRAIGEIGDATPAKQLLDLLDSLPAANELRYDIVNTLGILQYKPAWDSLRKIALNTGNPRYLRAFAITALGKLGDKRILPDFLKLLREDKLPDIKLRIIAAFGEMPSSETTAAIQSAMNDSDERIRGTAIVTAGKSKDKKLVAALLYKFRYDTDAKVMLLAAETLRDLGHEEIIKLMLVKMEVTRDAAVFSRFVDILKKCPPQPQAAAMLRKKQEEMKYSKVKDEIAALLDLWSIKKTETIKPANSTGGTKPAVDKTPAGSAAKNPDNDMSDEPRRIIIRD